MTKRRFFILSLVFLGFLALLFLHFYIPRFITEIKNPVINLVRTHISKSVNTFENNKFKGKKIEFLSKDKLILKGYLTYSILDSSKATIILLHGIRSKKEAFIALSEKLAKLGFNTVALDLRAHGESQGKHCTFGVKEKEDISNLIDYLKNSEKITGNIGIWGQSLGAAIAIQAMGADQRIKFGIIESTFSDFRIITNDYFNYHLGFNVRFLTNYLIDRAGKLANFDPENASPKIYSSKIEQAVLMVHGNQDRRINIKYGKENFANLKTSNKEFLEIDGATHLTIWKQGGKTYFDKVINFIEKNL